MPRLRNSRECQLGFSLIEILVVLVIMGLLTAIIFSLAGNLHENRQAIQNTIKLRKILHTHLTYVSEYGEFIHFEAKGKNPYTSVFVREYGLSWQDFASPDVDNEEYLNLGLRNWYVSYGYNSRDIGSSYYNGGSTQTWNTHDYRYGAPARFEELTDPMQTIVLVDTMVNKLNESSGRPYGGFHTYGSHSATIANPAPYARFKGQVTVGWADGHVSRVDWPEGQTPQQVLPRALWTRAGSKP